MKKISEQGSTVSLHFLSASSSVSSAQSLSCWPRTFQQQSLECTIFLDFSPSFEFCCCSTLPSTVFYLTLKMYVWFSYWSLGTSSSWRTTVAGCISRCSRTDPVEALAIGAAGGGVPMASPCPCSGSPVLKGERPKVTSLVASCIPKTCFTVSRRELCNLFLHALGFSYHMKSIWPSLKHGSCRGTHSERKCIPQCRKSN